MSISPDIGQAPAKSSYKRHSDSCEFEHSPYVLFTGSIQIAGQSQSLGSGQTKNIACERQTPEGVLTLSEALRVQ